MSKVILIDIESSVSIDTSGCQALKNILLGKTVVEQ